MRKFVVRYAYKKYGELTFNVNSALELMDCCLRSRYRNHLQSICKKVSRYFYVELDRIRNSKDKEEIERACMEAWNNHVLWTK